MNKIKEWKKFQHYNCRKPPWIKLYRELLDDPDWYELSGEDAKALMMLWLIGSEDEGQLPCVRKLAFRLRMKENAITPLLNRLSHWLELDASTMLAPRYQDAILERERQVEIQGEREKDKASFPQPSVADLDKEFEEWWRVYPRRETNADKGAARKKYQLVRRKEASSEDLLNGARAYAAENPEPKYTKQAATWLNKKCWVDYSEKGVGRGRGPRSTEEVHRIIQQQREEAERAIQAARNGGYSALGQVRADLDKEL